MATMLRMCGPRQRHERSSAYQALPVRNKIKNIVLENNVLERGLRAATKVQNIRPEILTRKYLQGIQRQTQTMILPSDATSLRNIGQFPPSDARFHGTRVDAQWNADAYDKLRLLRSRTRSSASICTMSSRKPSMSSLWRRASPANSAAISAMKAAASSGPPSAGGSSIRDRRPLPEGLRVRPRPVLVKKLHPISVLLKISGFSDCNYRRYFTTSLTWPDGPRAPFQHLSI
jgi:hypothetical protein